MKLSPTFEFDLTKMTPTQAAETLPAALAEITELRARIDAGTATIPDGAAYVAMVAKYNELAAAAAAFAEQTQIDVPTAPAPAPAPEAPVAPADVAPAPLADPAAPPAPLAEVKEQESNVRELVAAAVADALHKKTAPMVPAPAMLAAVGTNEDNIQLAGPISDAEFGQRVADFMQRPQVGTTASTIALGGWRTFSDEDIARGIHGKMSPDAVMAAVGRGISGDRLPEIDPVTAAPCPDSTCVRYAIADVGDMSDPLGDAFSEFPCERGQVEFFRGISLSEVSGDVNVWNTAAQAAMDAAFAAYRAAVTAAVPVPATISAAWAALKAAEKTCAQAACRGSVKAPVLPLAICLEITNELGYSQPEAVAAYRAALMRALVRERNRQRRTLMQSFSHHYGVDGADYQDMGAIPTVFEALKTALSMGVLKERIQDGGYEIGIDYGFLSLLEIDDIKSNLRMDDLREAVGGLPIRVLLDAAIGKSSPFAADLVPVGPPAGALPKLPGFPIGTVTAPWQIEIYKPSSIETFSVPDITMTATRSVEQAMQNRQMVLFLETFEGMIKPGVEPSYTLNFTNMIPSGRRAALDVTQDATGALLRLQADSEVPPLADTGDAATNDVLTSDQTGDGIPDLV
jgi:hypothetical protein